MVEALKWDGDAGKLFLLDQRMLPEVVEYVECADCREISEAIRDMVVRGAPAIGIAGGYGVAVAARQAMGQATGGVASRASGETPVETPGGTDALARFRRSVTDAAPVLSSARPTAVNLKWAVDRVLARTLEAVEGGRGATGSTDFGPAEAEGILHAAVRAAEGEARAIEREDIQMNHKMGEHGAALIKPGSRVLTHCNAGALATGGYGTALGVIRRAWEDGKVKMVYADETRPWLQGARLTAWELVQDGIDVTLLVDSAAGYLMSRGGIDCVVVGADRIARNGDVANKIGTYSVACLANLHGIPFYVAAPTSTFDLSIPDMSGIPVEQRAESEVLSFRGKDVAPKGAKAFNPAFDLTPARLVSAIITERGVILPPYWENLPKIVLGDDSRA